MRATQRFLNLILIPVLLAGLFLIPGTPAGASPAADPFSPSARQVMAALPPGGMATFIVTLRDQLAAPPAAGAALSPLQAAAAQPTKAARQQAVIQALQSYAAGQQAGLLAQAADLQARGQVGRLIPFWIFNGISIQAAPAAIQALAARPEVLSITPDPDPSHPIRPLDDFQPGASKTAQSSSSAPAVLSPEPNLTLVKGPDMWAKGYTGQGIVVASLDTGVDATHPDLAASYRGGANSWYDPYGENPTPVDFYGHGTRTMGIMVGGGDPAAPGLIGMAPGARWISAKIFNNAMTSTDTAVHQAFQWVMNPNNNPANTGAPDVVNNSWGGSGCVLTFQLDVTALRAAGILPVFSAGNIPSTDSFPANNAGAFAVGAIDNNSNIASFSSRGPNSCDASTYPQLVAPGEATEAPLDGIMTSAPGGGYDNSEKGTSFAAPHVSGALALLLSAMPYLTPDQQEQALIHGAAPLGPTPPNNTFGNGRLNVLASFDWLNTPLKIPASLSATPISATRIDLSWTDSNGGSAQYEISHSPDKKTWTPLTTTSAGASAYSDTSGLTGDTRYYYRVRAVQGGTASQYAGLSAVTQVDALQPPTGLVASPAQTIQVDVSWVNHSATANYVEIQRSPTGLAGSWVTLSNTLPPTTTLYSDSAGLVENTTYYYQVRARNTTLGMDSTFAGPAQATVPLMAPTGLVATAVGPSQINLGWTDHSLAATGYEVQRSLTGVSGWTLLATLGPGAHTFSDNDSANLSEGGLYFYQVRAVGSGVVSTYASANTRTLLKAPESLAAAAVSPTQVNLSWVNTSSLAAGIKIQRSTDALTWDPLITLGSSAATYNDTNGLSEGTHYYYQVQAVSAGLASAFVNAEAVTPLLPPSSLAAVPVSASRIDLRWSNHSLAATGMELQRSPDGVTGWATIFFSWTSPLPSAYSDTQVTPGSTYYYQVRATGAASNSAYTSPVHVLVAPYWIYTVIMFK